MLFPASPARRRSDRLVAEGLLSNDPAIPLQIRALQILQEAAAVIDHPQQAATSMVILRMGLEVSGEAVDALGEQRDLHRSGSGVRLVMPVFPNRRRLVVHLFVFPNRCEHSKLEAHRASVKAS